MFKHITTQNFTVLLVFFVSFSYFLESFFYPDILQKYFTVSAQCISLVSLPILVLLRIISKKSLSDSAQKYFTLAAPSVLSIYIILSILNSVLYPSFSLATLHLHAEPLQGFGLFLTVVALSFWSKTFITNNKYLLISIAPIWILCLSYLLTHFSDTVWYHLDKEDSFFEWLTFLFYAYSSYYAAQIALQFKCHRFFSHIPNKICFILYILAAFIFFVVAGEEISWAQRVLSYKTPEEIRITNTQSEFNIHNNQTVFQYVYYAYGVIAIYGAFSWLISDAVRKSSKNKVLTTCISLFTPQKYLMGYFIPMIIYVSVRIGYSYELLDKLEEFKELLLTIGILLFMHHTFKKVQKLPKLRV